MQLTDNEKWEAVSNCNQSYDGKFVYVVKTVGVFCRPSCKSRLPLRKNVIYFDTPQEAINQGFRPCKKCRPDIDEYSPDKEIASRLKELIDEYYLNREVLSAKIDNLGMSQGRLAEVFKMHYGITPNEYILRTTLFNACKLLKQTNKDILSIALISGYNEASSFSKAFKRIVGFTPSEYRENNITDIYYTIYDSPIGKLIILEKNDKLIKVCLLNHMAFYIPTYVPKETTLLLSVKKQLDEYFSGSRKVFDIPIWLDGSAFCTMTWNALKQIEYGKTASYKDIAVMINKPKSSRAVGLANNRNPLLIIIPCHRIIGANGHLVGYGGGLEVKKYLLKHESEHAND